MFDGSPPVQAHGTEVIGVDCDAESPEAGARNIITAVRSSQFDWRASDATTPS